MAGIRFSIQLIRTLGFLPLRLSLYRMAFCPRSSRNRQGLAATVNNERLEFLGDAVLDAVVADYLYRKFPTEKEGFMTKMRSRIVKRRHLDHLAVRIGIPSLMPSGIHPGNRSKHLYGNALEALVGAIYLDRGYGRAKRFVLRRVLLRHIQLEKLVKKDPDHKSRVIEWAQKNGVEVVFESIEEHGTGGNSPVFVSTILLNGEKEGTGRGQSKKEAEQRAARTALSGLNHTEQLETGIPWP